MALLAVNRSVRLAGVTVHSGVNVSMDDAAGTVTVMGFDAQRNYGQLALYERLAFQYRRASGDAAYLLGSQLLEVVGKKGCGCR